MKFGQWWMAAALLGAAGGYSGEPGWAVHYYGDPVFFGYGGMKTIPTAEIGIPGNFIQLPPDNADPAKGPVFFRRGWSIAARATLAIPADGVYEFRTEPGANDATARRIAVNGEFTDAIPGGRGIRLNKGVAQIVVYARPARKGLSGTPVRFQLLWKKPGDGAFAPVTPEITDADRRPPRLGPDIEFAYRDGVHRDFASRRFKLNIPETGLYEIGVRFQGVPRYCRVWLDDRQILYVQGERQGVTDAAEYGDVDRTGARDRQRLDFFGRARSVRRLEKGVYNLDLYAHYGPWLWDDEMEQAMRRISFGVTRLTGKNPQDELGFVLEDRDHMVFRKGETLQLRAEGAGAVRLPCRMEVAPRGGKTVWSRTLDVGRTPVRFEYPCEREGAFEYTIRNVKGEVIDGPWAFAVVDPTPVARSGQRPGTALEPKTVTVDRVECTEGPEGPHDFRDNGTSKVVETPHGKYRVTGETGFHRTPYVHLKNGIRRAKKGEKANFFSENCDWYAYTLKVKNPGRPHLIRAMIPNDRRRLVGIQAIDRKTANSNGWLLDAGDAPAAGPFSPLTFFVWPNSDAIDVMVFCSNGNHNSDRNRQGAASVIELLEFPEGIPALPEAVGGWRNDGEFGWQGEQVDLGVNERTMPPLWEGDDMLPANAWRGGQRYHSWNDLLLSWGRFGEVSAYRGDNLCISRFTVIRWLNFRDGRHGWFRPARNATVTDGAARWSIRSTAMSSC